MDSTYDGQSKIWAKQENMSFNELVDLALEVKQGLHW